MGERPYNQWLEAEEYRISKKHEFAAKPWCEDDDTPNPPTYKTAKCKCKEAGDKWKQGACVPPKCAAFGKRKRSACIKCLAQGGTFTRKGKVCTLENVDCKSLSAKKCKATTFCKLQGKKTKRKCVFK